MKTVKVLLENKIKDSTVFKIRPAYTNQIIFKLLDSCLHEATMYEVLADPPRNFVCVTFFINVSSYWSILSSSVQNGQTARTHKQKVAEVAMLAKPAPNHIHIDWFPCYQKCQNCYLDGLANNRKQELNTRASVWI